MSESADTRYTVLIADISGSRRLTDKQEFQERLWQVVHDQTMQHFSHAMATRFEVTAWDEWEGVLQRPAAAWDVIRLWEDSLGQGRLSVGVGLGTLEGPLDRDPRKVTGEAFYLARHALEEAKNRRSIAHFAGNAELADLNLALLLRSALVRRLTQRQREVISVYERLGDVTRVGRELAVTHQNISQILRTAEYEAILSAERYVRDRLSQLSTQLSTPEPGGGR